MPTSTSNRPTVWQRLAVTLTLTVACAVAHADPVTFSGSTTDCSNPALVGSGPNQPAPTCTTTQDQANNVAVYTFTVPFGGFTDFNFGGFSDIDFTPFLNFGPSATPFLPNLSIFQGTGPSALFVTSSAQNQLPIQTAASSADLHVFLNAGIYTLAISNQSNLALGQFQQGGTLGQGFLGRGDPNTLGNGAYQLTATPIPEPDSAWLAAIGVAALLLRRRQRRGAIDAV